MIAFDLRVMAVDRLLNTNLNVVCQKEKLVNNLIVVAMICRHLKKLLQQWIMERAVCHFCSFSSILV